MTGMGKLRSSCAQSRRSWVEALEGRTLLAGNVFTLPMGTPDSPGEPAPDLFIQGDGLANEIMIKKGNAPDEVIVNGLNGTLVNFSNQEWHFQGVERIVVQMAGGNDVVDVRNLEFSSEFLADLSVDGGAGDDRITVFNTSIDATAPDGSGNSVSVLLTGEILTAASGTTTGNDIIDVSNTTLFAEGGEMTSAALSIFGDINQGGTITGGNDRISVTNTDIIATDASLGNGAGLQIVGDLNFADAMSTATSTIGQGNDTISVTNTTVAADGMLLSSNSVLIDIQGDQNLSSTGAVATIGGGNDTISIRDFVASASGGLSNTVDLNIFGDGDVSSVLDLTSTIGGGNDVISLVNDDIVAAGGTPNAATVLLYSDDRTQGGEADTTVGQGNDDVTISNFLLEASTSSNLQLHTQKGTDFIDIHNSQFGGFGMSTGTGNDDVTILNSDWMTGNFDLEEGNDILRMNGNSFVITNAEGGLGIDTLHARNNMGVLVPTGFEIFT